MIEIHIKKNESDQRIDKFLRKYMPKAPLSLIYRLLRKKQVKVNAKKVYNHYVLREGDIVQLYIREENIREFTQTKMIKAVEKNFSIIYEDSNLLLVDKPQGLLVHSDRNENQNTLIDQVIRYLYEKGEYDPTTEKTFIPACVNRLDRNTSGLVLIGKNHQGLQSLNKMMRERWIRRYYLALVKGSVIQEGELKGRLIKDDKNKARIVKSNESFGKAIHTIYKPIQYNPHWSLLEIEIVTGRPHQIRLHLSDIGHPIIGDYKYGDFAINEGFQKKFGLKYQLLHAYKIFFENTTENISYLRGRTFYSSLPPFFNQVGKYLFLDSWDPIK